MKICKKCNKSKALKMFGIRYKYKKKNGELSIYRRDLCKECNSLYMSENMIKYKNSKKTKAKKVERDKLLRAKYPKKYNCRKDLNKMITLGKIKKRNSCEICYNYPTECHHEDYGKPLDFIELCIKCHNFVHQQYKRQGIVLT